jgi:hypothetical protein
MKKVSAYFTRFKQSESIQFLLDVAKLCSRSQFESLTAPLEKVVNSNTMLIKSFKKEQKSNITELLTAYDQRRDDAVKCLRMTALAYLNHFDEEKREAAQDIIGTIDRYGNRLHKLNYQAETSVLSNLYDDLSKEPKAALVAQLHMTEVLEEMNASNSLFNDSYVERIEEEAAKDQVSTAELLRVAIADYRELISIIEAHNTINTEGGYDALLQQIYELAEKYNALIKPIAVNEESS